MTRKNTDSGDLINRHWLVGIADDDEELLIHAAYVVYHDVFETPTIHDISGGSGPKVAMATLKDENHKVVFQMPMAALRYVRRGDVTAKVSRHATPGDVRNLGAELAGASACP